MTIPFLPVCWNLYWAKNCIFLLLRWVDAQKQGGKQTFQNSEWKEIGVFTCFWWVLEITCIGDRCAEAKRRIASLSSAWSITTHCWMLPTAAVAIPAADSPCPALGVALNNPQQGKFCYEKSQPALPVTAFFLRGLSSLNCISGFTEHHRFLFNLRVGGLANICAVPVLGFWLYGKSLTRNKRMFNIIWNSKTQQTSLPLILSLWEQMDCSVLLPSSSKVAKADSQNKMWMTHEPQNILIN